jgi:voltage-gated potassium channel Kch
MSSPPAGERKPQLPERVQIAVWGFGVVVLLLAIVAFLAGAQVSERDLSEVGILGHLYHAIGLFVVGGMDLGMPKNDPLVPGLVLWFAYFAAPGVTVATVVLAFLKTFADRAIVQMPLDHHIVLVGHGRLARAYLDVIERLEPDRQVMVVHPDTELLPANTRSRRHVRGDIRDLAVQRQLRLDRAEAVMLLTRDDLLNIEAATAISSSEPRLANRMVVHLADIGLKRLITGDRKKGLSSTVFFKMGDSDQEASKGSLLAIAPSQLINSHRIAARHMVLHDLLPASPRPKPKTPSSSRASAASARPSWSCSSARPRGASTPWWWWMSRPTPGSASSPIRWA